MKRIATVRMTEAAARYSEHAPLATACCNACRSCVTANAVSVATGAVLAATAAVSRLVRRRTVG